MPGNLTFEGLLRTPLQVGGRITQPWAEFFEALALGPASMEDMARLVAVIADQSDSGQGAAVLYGAHADRPPVASVVDGTQYAETDRAVVYQARAGAWIWTGGEMAGTLTPDQRPADLGANDAGFRFRATDDQEYIHRWDGAAWQVLPVATTRVHLTEEISGARPHSTIESATATGKTRFGRVTDDNAFDVLVNVSYDGAFNLDDTTKYGAWIRLNPTNAAGSRAFALYLFTPGANPRTATAVIYADNNGNVGFGKAPGAYGVDALRDINTGGVFRVAGMAGLTAARTVVYSVIPVTTTLNYKDHAGVNQSMTVQTGTVVSTTTHGFTGGILTT